jgi:hypothetical protein
LQGFFYIGVDFTPTYIVNTAILRPAQEPKACALGAPKMLMNAGIKGVTLRSCYCCSEFGSVIYVLDGPNRDSVLEAFNRINVPVASIMEAEEIKVSSINARMIPA